MELTYCNIFNNNFNQATSGTILSQTGDIEGTKLI
jgi:hypothetical protein